MATSNEHHGPLVSIILPVFNGEPYLAAAVESMVSQTYSNLEMILIDDGSTDASLQTLRRFADADPRIRLVSRENKGLVASLNEGLGLATGKYIARMDADDVSDITRIQRQVAYLNENPEVVLLGVRTYHHKWRKWRLPGYQGKHFWTWRLLFTNRIGHPGVMFRRDTLERNHLRYDETFKHVEDYQLWCQMIAHGMADVLPLPLLFYRRHASAVSIVNAETQRRRDRIVSRDHIRNQLGIEMEDVQEMDQSIWLNALRHRIFRSPLFSALSQEDCIAIHLAYQELAVRAGIVALVDYVRLVGLRPLLSNGLASIAYLARVLAYAAINNARRSV